MIPYAARSFTDPAGFMNSAFPRISQPVSSDRRRSRINGVFPTYPSIPEYAALMSSEFLGKIAKPTKRRTGLRAGRLQNFAALVRKISVPLISANERLARFLL